MNLAGLGVGASSTTPTAEMTTASILTVLIPGLACSARVWEPVIDAVWSRGPVLVADTRRGDSVGEIAARLLAAAPARFALVGISMGGYLCFEVLRQAPERVLGVGFLSTSARADTVAQAAIDCPALVVHGAEDQLIAPENGAEIAAGITGSVHSVVPDCGHMSNVEAPAPVAQAVGALLDSL